MKIREIKKTELKILLILLKEAGYIQKDAEEKSATDYLEEALLKENGMRFVGAFREEELVGTISIVIGYSTYQLKKFAWCDDLFVKESCRGMKIGEKLIAYAEEIAERERCSNILLGVGDDEKNAIGFYVRHAFRDMGCRLFTKPLHPEVK